MEHQPSQADWLDAVRHPCRVQILRRLLTAGTATPVDIARDIGRPLGPVGYHVRYLSRSGILRLAGHTRLRGASVRHYQLAERDRAASVLAALDASLLVTEFERQNGKGDVTVILDREALAESHELTSSYLARLGELGLQTRERYSSSAQTQSPTLTRLAVLVATDEHAATAAVTWR